MIDETRRHVLQTALGGAVWAAAGPAAHAEGADQWPDVIKAAKAEGKLTMYTANVGNTTHKQVADAFEKKYGITVTILEGRASEIRERVRSEQAAGRFVADISHNGSTTTGLQLEAGTFMPHGYLPGLDRVRAPFKVDDVRVPVFAIAYAILINDRLVKAADAPRSWKDLTDPRWQGKILSDDMRALGGGSVLFFTTEEKFGSDFHQKLAANKPVFSRDLAASERRVARGEFPIWIPLNMGDFPLLHGLPVRFVLPTEGLPYVTYELAMLKNAPHPNAARLFMAHYLEDSAQLVHGNAGNLMVVDSVAAKLIPEMHALSKAPLLGTTDWRRQDAMLKLAADIYK